MKYILLIILLLVNKQAICQSSGTSRRDIEKMRKAIRDASVAATSESFGGNSWRIPAVEGFDWVRYVDRIIDLSNEQNRPLSHIDSEKTITDVLIDLLKTGKITAYSDTLDSAAIGSGEAVTSILKENTVIKNYMLLECWKFSRSKRIMIAKIIGIAPCVKNDTTFQPVAWFKYSSLHTYFGTYNIPNVQSLDDYFENRMFLGKIVKIIPRDLSDKIH